MNWLWAEPLAAALAETTGLILRISGRSAVSGGCLHHAWRLETNHGPFFVKVATAANAASLDAEATNLRMLQRAAVIRVPQIILRLAHQGEELLILEWIDFSSPSPRGWRALGEQLAQLHNTLGDAYGWPEDNVIGQTPQPNRWVVDWGEFFWKQRIQPMLALLEKQRISFRGVSDLESKIPGILSPAQLRPSLTHGDLWSGNIGFAHNGEPVLFDPACSYAHDETDLAMTLLFGGFPSEFYQAYHTLNPPQPGAEKRLPLYQLYHILNHALLFGGGYIGQSQHLITQITT